LWHVAQHAGDDPAEWGRADHGTVTLKGISISENARQAAVVAAENVLGVKGVENRISNMADYPAAQEGGDFVSLQEQPSTTDDIPL
jgi:hypothetical protein